ncbi:hypothetical protein ACUNV4_01100 [Granulosicoccus sp. 3-233]|uniref:hypothetical protein n=1 Tax=Granulosicoccus sp. 3-233 TaxID=3417969 RepID=UPI003D33E5A6
MMCSKRSSISAGSTSPAPQLGTDEGNRFPRRRLVVAMALAAMTLGACSDDDDSNDMGGSDPVIPEGRFAVAMNDGQGPGSVSILAPDIATERSTLATGANQGLTIGADGTLYQNSDAEGSVGMRAFNRAVDRTDMDEFGALDRLVGNSPGKGLATLSGMGLLASCDVSDQAADLKLYSTSAGEQASPVAQVDLPASCWDSTYDAQADRLYLAMTDGTLGIVDAVAELGLLMPAEGDSQVSLGADIIDRMVSVVDADGMQRSVNFHGVAVEDGMVLVSDVGSADSATDGALYVFADDGELNGEQSVDAIEGPATLLGNPVDVLLVEGSAIVAEKSNDAILVFNDVATRAGDVAPDYMRAFTKPESLVQFGDDDGVVDASDLTADSAVSRLLVSQNPTVMQQGGEAVDNSSVGSIRVLDLPLDAAQGEQSVMAGMVSGDPGQEMFRTLESIQLDAAGNGYAVFDTTDGSSVSDRGLLVIDRLDSREGTAVDTMTRDRLLGGASAGLTSPKGVEIAGEQGALIVSDIGNDSVAASLVVLSTSAGSNAMPLFTVMDTGSAAIWDTDYDPQNDRLYAAGTAGDVLVYDDFFAMGASAVPTRSIRAAAAGAVSNIHGIVHDLDSDTLIVTDVGDAASASDGALYVIDDASTASGEITPRAMIAGAATALGNPVDLAFDGAHAYIAEKSNDQVLIYRDVLSLEGEMDVAADESVAVLKPESVVLAR